MGLLRNDHTLRSDSYFQNTFYQRHSREKLVWTIWKSGQGSDVVQWQPESHGQTTAPKSKRGARRETPTGGCRKNKLRKIGRLVPGSAKMQSLIKWYVDKQTHKDNGSGQKRNARSVAEERAEKSSNTYQATTKEEGENGHQSLKHG